MKQQYVKVLGLLLLAFGCAPSATPEQTVEAQGVTVEQVVEAWDQMTTMVVESAKLMPAEHFGFTPGEPLRPFAAQINHTAGANYLFAEVYKASRPDREVNASEKEDVIRDLEASFAFVREGLASLSQADLAETIQWFGRDMSRLQGVLTMTDHLQREHGKTIMYLRAKGIAPAQSAGW